MGLALIAGLLIRFEEFLFFFYLWYKIKVQLSSFACAYTVVPAPFVEETLHSPLNGLAMLLKVKT